MELCASVNYPGSLIVHTDPKNEKVSAFGLQLYEQCFIHFTNGGLSYHSVCLSQKVNQLEERLVASGGKVLGIWAQNLQEYLSFVILPSSLFPLPPHSQTSRCFKKGWMNRHLSETQSGAFLFLTL